MALNHETEQQLQIQFCTVLFREMIRAHNDYWCLSQNGYGRGSSHSPSERCAKSHTFRMLLINTTAAFRAYFSPSMPILQGFFTQSSKFRAGMKSSITNMNTYVLHAGAFRSLCVNW